MTIAAYAEKHNAIIGQSGSGKTVTAKKRVEGLLEGNQHVAILDPTGVWWGLRSNAAGDGPGFDIPIFGGLHGDVPITVDQGEAVGKIIAGGVSAIVDVSEMEGREQRKFVLDFIRALRKKPRGRIHLVVDEADEFAAQTAPDAAGFALNEQMTWIAKRGRYAGFILTLITQRTADISWAVLSQSQTVIIHNLFAPNDLAVVEKYLKANATKEQRLEVMKSVPELDIGHRWIYSPRLKILECDRTPLPATFDSSAAPADGETPHEPKMLAQIDLGEIREMLAPPVEEDEEQGESSGHFNGPSAGAELQDEINALREKLRDAEEVRDQAERDAHRWHDLAKLRAGQLDRIALICAEEASTTEELVEVVVRSYDPVPIPSIGLRRKPFNFGKVVGVDALDIPEPSPMPRPLSMDELAERQGLGGTDVAPRWIKILDAIAWAHVVLKMGAVDRAVIAYLKGGSPKSSGFENDLGAMRTRGLISYPTGGTVALTADGRSFAKSPITPPASDDLRKVVKAALDLQSPKIFEAIGHHVPKREIYDMVTSWLEPRHKAILDAVKGYQVASRETVAEFLGKSPKSSGFENDLGKLRTLGLIDYPKPGYVALGTLLA
jgi:hypothetical protein